MPSSVDIQRRIDEAIKNQAGKVSDRQIRLSRIINSSRPAINYYVQSALSEMPGTVTFGLMMACKAMSIDPEENVPDILIRFVMTLPPNQFKGLWDELGKMVTYAAKGSADV